MIEADFGGRGPAAAQAPGAGDTRADSGAVAGAGAPSAPSRTGTPDHIRAILAGISAPAPAAPTLTVVRPTDEAPPAAPAHDPGPVAVQRAPEPAAVAAAVDDPGALSLASVDVVLPHILESARAAGRPLSVVVARPGPAAVPGVRLAPPSPGAVADLAAALAVSLGPEQDLLADGPHHLVVTTLGGAPRRATATLMQRAAEAGAPMFTWAGARFPQDAQSAAELLDMARARVDGAEPVAEDERRGKVAAVWVGVAAALAVAAFAFLFHGHGAHSPSRAAGAVGGSGQLHGGAASLAGGSSTGSGNLSGAGTGGSASGGSATYIYSSPGTGGGSGTGSNAGTGSTGSGSTGSGGGSTGTTVPSNSTPTTIGNTTPTTTANTTGNTTTTVASTTTTTVCSTNLLGQLICTVNGLLGH